MAFVRAPAGMRSPTPLFSAPGQRATMGTRSVSSYGVQPLIMQRCAPTLSPWSAPKTVSVVLHPPGLFQRVQHDPHRRVDLLAVGVVVAQHVAHVVLGEGPPQAGLARQQAGLVLERLGAVVGRQLHVFEPVPFQELQQRACRARAAPGSAPRRARACYRRRTRGSSAPPWWRCGTPGSPRSSPSISIHRVCASPRARSPRSACPPRSAASYPGWWARSPLSGCVASPPGRAWTAPARGTRGSRSRAGPAGGWRATCRRSPAGSRRRSGVGRRSARPAPCPG